jgi:hypothetical protein
VAQHDVGLHAHRAQQGVERLRAHEHGLGADVHVVHAPLEFGAARSLSPVGGGGDVGATLARHVRVQAAPEIQPVAHVVKALGHVRQHGAVLRTLAREDEGQLASSG